MKVNIKNQFTNLCINLNNLATKNHLKTFILTSTKTNEGKTTLAIQITRTLVEQGKRILIVDADPERANLSVRLGVNNRPGLTDLVENNAGNTPKQFILNTQLKDLDILPLGRKLRAEHYIIDHQKFEQLFSELKADYHYIIFDSANVNNPFTRQLTSECDGTVVVVRQNFTKVKELITALKQLEELNAHLLGCVLNAAE